MLSNIYRFNILIACLKNFTDKLPQNVIFIYLVNLISNVTNLKLFHCSDTFIINVVVFQVTIL
jgi:hypothetical protein